MRYAIQKACIRKRTVFLSSAASTSGLLKLCLNRFPPHFYEHLADVVKNADHTLKLRVRI